jgi:alpha,alpha-trehalase
VRTGRQLGNFPQAFAHLALITAVMHVIRADQGLEGRGAFRFRRGLPHQRTTM